MELPVSLREDDGIAIVTVDNPPVNALSHAVRRGIVECFEAAIRDDSVVAIVLHCGGRTFCAGADIREFGKPPKAPSLREMLEIIDACPKPVVAAVHGTAYGGGFETVLCCNYTVAATSAQFGLPESKLGLLPGAGGTQRLPRVVGAEKALDMMISGNPIGAQEAVTLGVAECAVADSELLDQAVQFARDAVQHRNVHPRASSRSLKAVTPDFFDHYRRRMSRRTRGFESPESIVQCVEAAATKPFAEGLLIEREMFEACLASNQSAAMRHLFFAERAIGKVPGIDRAIRATTIDSVGVIGAGTMGAGIALACLTAGLNVMLLDNSTEGLERGRETIHRLLASQVEKGRLSKAEQSACLKRLTAGQDYALLSDVDLVIEAAFESMSVKQAIFSELNRVCKATAILATNTSSLNVDQIAASTKCPEAVIGLHFFSPAHVMRLLEIVRGAATGDAAIITSLEFGKQIGKLGVVVGNCPGFVGNRMLYGYGRENQLLLLEGASPEQIDTVLTDWGMAMGPNEVGDLAGLDIGYKGRQERSDLPDDPRYYRIADMLAEMGRFGQKTGAGIYRYESGSRKPIPDPEVHELIRAEADRLGIEQRAITPDEIVERCISALALEGARILEEGIAARSGDINVIWANGYGFPRYRGGPMFHADTIGLQNLRDNVMRLAEVNGERYWQVPALLQQLADQNMSFADYDARQ